MNPEAVRAWWQERSKVEGDLETDLRAYVFRLERGHHPGATDRLPQL